MAAAGMRAKDVRTGEGPAFVTVVTKMKGQTTESKVPSTEVKPPQVSPPRRVPRETTGPGSHKQGLAKGTHSSLTQGHVRISTETKVQN